MAKLLVGVSVGVALLLRMCGLLSTNQAIQLTSASEAIISTKLLAVIPFSVLRFFMLRPWLPIIDVCPCTCRQQQGYEREQSQNRKVQDKWLTLVAADYRQGQLS